MYWHGNGLGDYATQLPFVSMDIDRSKSFENKLVLGIFLIDLVVAILAVIFLFNSHEYYKYNLDVTSHNLAQLLDHSIADNARFIDDAVVRVKRALELQLTAGGVDIKHLQQLLDSEQKQLPEIEAIRITNTAGDVVFGKGVVPEGMPLTLTVNFFVNIANRR